MGVQKLYPEIHKLGLASLTTSLAVALHHIEQGPSLSPDQSTRPLTPPVGLHFIDEVSPIRVPIERSMLQSPIDRRLPPAEFNKKLEAAVVAEIWRRMEEREVVVPGSYHTWIMEGPCRSEFKRVEVENRLNVSIAGELRRDAWREKGKKKEEGESRPEHLAKRNDVATGRGRIKRAEKRKAGKEAGGDCKEGEGGKVDGEESNKSERADVVEGAAECGVGAKGGGAEKEKTPLESPSVGQPPASFISVKHVRFPCPDFDLFNYPGLHVSRRTTPPSSRIRVIEARQEAESLLDFAATLDTVFDSSTVHPTAKQVERVLYGSDAQPGNFVRDPFQTVSCLIDSDQFATARHSKVGWSLHPIVVGRKNYDAHVLTPGPDSPQADPIVPTKKEKVHGYRIIEIGALVNTVYNVDTQEGIAGIFVLTGNDYSKGGLPDKSSTPSATRARQWNREESSRTKP
ncbi:uncharacterized protein JCM6883_007243 [Sporobolomyces salmoneus]|uniref:uncharacterized protein n=1 Tax=Sporobolomyces salmoneus TaxID=183962 RepID=UPI00317FE9E5